MTHDYECPQCEEVSVFEITPEEAPIVGLAPHRCEPGHRREVDGPSVCVKCGFTFDEQQIYYSAIRECLKGFE